MGRERQKRKNRSSVSKVRQRSKSKKQVFNNAVIAANWDKNQTMSQNYSRLGLTVKLNKQSGGVENTKTQPNPVEGDSLRRTAGVDGLTIKSSHNQHNLDLEELKVERDPKTGRITRILSLETASARSNPLNDPLFDLDSASDSDSSPIAAPDDQHSSRALRGNRPLNSAHAGSDVIVELEKRAKLPAAKHKRRQTDNEREFIQDLVRKHGFDYDQMARDIKTNYMQRSAGDLKRRVKKWQENGGSIS